MAFKTTVFFCAQIFLIQSAMGQLKYGNYLPSALSGINNNNIMENTVVISNNAAPGGVGLANSGAIGSTVGLANTGVFGSGIGLANAGLGSGIGLTNTGLLGSGLNIANTGVIGNAVLPAANVNYLNLASLSSGGVLPINSFSPIVPAGLTVVSENAIEGPLAIVGQLPFLSAVAFEGALASEGAGAAGCGCGTSGNIGIVSESYGPIATPAIGGLGVGAGIGLGAGRGLAGLY
ncbi:uncharacterized protein ACR2FA_010889 [Aphomia sociella]